MAAEKKSGFCLNLDAASFGAWLASPVMIQVPATSTFHPRFFSHTVGLPGKTMVPLPSKPFDAPHAAPWPPSTALCILVSRPQIFNVPGLVGLNADVMLVFME